MYGQGYHAQAYKAVSQYSSYPPRRDGGDRHETQMESAVRRREETRRMIETFIGQCEDGTEAVEGESERGLKICQAKETLVEAFASISQLERLKTGLSENSCCSDEEYSRVLRDCSDIEERLERALDEFELKLPQLKKRLDDREKKRAREMRRRVQRRAEKIQARERRARRNDEIDAWIREKREILERERQVENLRKDADVVLADVRGKRNDAKKFLGLLHELRNLRRVTVNVARARGENLPLAADQAFDNIIDQLVEEWSCLDREYSIEEQGLKLMLKADNEEKIEKRKRSTFDDWELALFGKKLASSSAMSLDYFLMIRHAWDKYANFERNGSRVPISWIIPVAPSSAAWQKCLKRH